MANLATDWFRRRRFTADGPPPDRAASDPYRAVEWTSDAEHWAGIDDVSLPNVPPREGEPLVPQLDGLLVRDGDRALVFLGNDGVIEYIVATSIDDEGKAQVVHGC